MKGPSKELPTPPPEEVASVISLVFSQCKWLEQPNARSWLWSCGLDWVPGWSSQPAPGTWCRTPYLHGEACGLGSIRSPVGRNCNRVKSSCGEEPAREKRPRKRNVSAMCSAMRFFSSYHSTASNTLAGRQTFDASRLYGAPAVLSSTGLLKFGLVGGSPLVQRCYICWNPMQRTIWLGRVNWKLLVRQTFKKLALLPVPW